MELSDSQVLKIIEKYRLDPQKLISILLDIQEASGRNYVSQRYSQLVSKVLGVHITRIFEVLTFYSMFSTQPRGRHIIEICQSTPCHFQGGDTCVSWFSSILGLEVGETSPDNLFTLQRTNCLGACQGGPSVKIGDDIFGDLTKEKVETLIQSFRDNLPILREALRC
ncbi:MAG: NAD(P)H-dependent oxidoreductase subunit E [Deltaproteobacteria bacterium]|jgi:NADH-quinone oxidoreductase subunit E|nr:NAD(P)H-dependent oxidoreductase subunit E [Deltaproteobacteria bacterium]